jgi:hypothetical protein
VKTTQPKPRRLTLAQRAEQSASVRCWSFSNQEAHRDGYIAGARSTLAIERRRSARLRRAAEELIKAVAGLDFSYSRGQPEFLASRLNCAVAQLRAALEAAP